MTTDVFEDIDYPLTTLYIFTGQGIDMTNAAAVAAATSLDRFLPDGVFYGDGDRGDGYMHPLKLHSAANDMQIWLRGSFTYAVDGSLSGGVVTEMYLRTPEDMLIPPFVPHGWTGPEIIGASSTQLLFDFAVDVFDVIDAIENGDLAPLYAGDFLDISSGAGDDTLVGGPWRDLLGSGDGNDKMFGKGGADSMAGEAGNDTLVGGAGADALIGGRGNDVLYGGRGADVFAFWSTGSTGKFQSDTLEDFRLAEGDKVWLWVEGFDQLGPEGALAAGAFKSGSDIGGGNLGAGVDADDRILYDTDSGRLFYDANGSADGARRLIATLWSDGTQHPMISAADIIVGSIS